MPNAIRKRLRLHQDWTNDIPLKNIWGINFSSRKDGAKMSNVGGAIKHYLDIYRPQSYIVDPDLIDRVSDTEIGFMLAQAVALPSEGIDISTTPIEGAGGLMPAQLGGNRSSTNTLSITFLETNRDVFSFFIQPWIIATSYAGLIEDDSEPDIKCNIEVVQYSRSENSYANKLGGAGNSGIVEYTVRKIHTFYDAVPTTLEGGEMSYGSMSESDITRAAAFNFAYYKLNTPRGVLDGV
jgi:hypothetical protein